MWRILAVMIVCSLFWAACNKGKDDEDMYTVDALTFGTYYSGCDTNCVLMYEVTPSALSRDDSARLADIASWKYKFTTVNLLTGNKLAMAKPLLTEVPRELFGKNAIVYGNPGADGAIYIKVQTIPGSYRFKIDLRNTAGQSAEVVAFKQKVLDVMGKIK